VWGKTSPHELAVGDERGPRPPNTGIKAQVYQQVSGPIIYMREKRVVPAPTQGPMCEGEIVGVVPHRLWKGLVVSL